MLQEEMLDEIAEDPCAIETSPLSAGQAAEKQAATDVPRDSRQARLCESLDRRLIAIIRALDR